jgi:hypothetical protein
MSNKDLLKQAIAEAKTIREAAIANAKEALEESLTPHLKEMLAQKLQEMENDEMEVDETVNNVENERELINYVTEAEEDEDEEPVEDEEEVEGEEEEVEEDEEEIDPNDPDFAEKLKDLIRDIVAQETGHEDQAEMDQMDEPAEGEGMVGMEDEEEIDINELLAELEEGYKLKPGAESGDTHGANDGYVKKAKMEGMKKPKMEAMKKPNPMEEELDEALATVAELRKQLQEVNLLNAKLLYVNKVFKANNLTEGQKVNVVAAFDKAETVREVKLVFETVSKNVTSRPVTTVKEHKSFASKPAGSTQKQVINEVSEQVKRMQKLAGII